MWCWRIHSKPGSSPMSRSSPTRSTPWCCHAHARQPAGHGAIAGSGQPRPQARHPPAALLGPRVPDDPQLRAYPRRSAADPSPSGHQAISSARRLHWLRTLALAAPDASLLQQDLATLAQFGTVINELETHIGTTNTADAATIRLQSLPGVGRFSPPAWLRRSTVSPGECAASLGNSCTTGGILPESTKTHFISGCSV